MTAREVATYRKRLGLSKSALGRLLGVTHAAVVLWENGERQMREPTARLLKLLAERQPAAPAA
jgi:DNA-binding transcriptional regulator YiaG